MLHSIWYKFWPFIASMGLGPLVGTSGWVLVGGVFICPIDKPNFRKSDWAELGALLSPRPAKCHILGPYYCNSQRKYQIRFLPPYTAISCFTRTKFCSDLMLTASNPRFQSFPSVFRGNCSATSNCSLALNGECKIMIQSLFCKVYSNFQLRTRQALLLPQKATTIALKSKEPFLLY